jgi:hypothetical protein
MVVEVGPEIEQLVFEIASRHRHRSQPLAAFLDESRVAPHVVGMLLTVAALVVGTRSVNFLLVLIRSRESNPGTWSAIAD